MSEDDVRVGMKEFFTDKLRLNKKNQIKRNWKSLEMQGTREDEIKDETRRKTNIGRERS